MSQLIKSIAIPAAVRKQASKYTAIEIYDDKVVGKGNKQGDITYFFKDYMTVRWTPASLATQFAQVVFITHENANNYVSANNVNSFLDVNKIPFCSGMFSYAAANQFAESLHKDILNALNAYKSSPAADASATVVQQVQLSAADELKKFKDLLDSGVISQEEFDAKKKQILGL